MSNLSRRILRPRRVAAAAAVALAGAILTSGSAAATPPAGGAGAEATQELSARNAMVTLYNSTELTLNRSDYSLDHGEWATFPAEVVQSYHESYWQSDSDGVFTGTEGTVYYRTSAGDVRIHWDVPYSGGNSAQCSPPQGFVCQSNFPEHDNHVVFSFNLTHAVSW